MVIGGHRWLSGGHRWSSGVIGGHRWSSGGHQGSSVVIGGHLVVIGGHRWSSVVILTRSVLGFNTYVFNTMPFIYLISFTGHSWGFLPARPSHDRLSGHYIPQPTEQRTIHHELLRGPCAHELPVHYHFDIQLDEHNEKADHVCMKGIYGLRTWQKTSANQENKRQQHEINRSE